MPFVLKVLLLALVQGITEFLPVSSSGHLLLFQKILGFSAMPLVYDVFLHAGTLLAVAAFFFRDLRELALHCTRRENQRLLLLLAAASLPTALIGFLGKGFFESLFSRTSYLGISFLFTAAVLLAAKSLRLRRRLPDIAAALLIGVAQGIAIVPGISRSGMTIAVALALGLAFEFSFRFSFLLSIPAVLGAVVLEAGNIPWSGGHAPMLALAVLASAATGFIVLAWLKRITVRDHFHRFAYYLIPLGAATLWFL